MSQLSDRQLCTQAWEAVRNRVGPAETLRFLSLIRNPPRDYQRWRDEFFKDLTVDELFDRMSAPPANSTTPS